MADNLRFYNASRAVPEEAQKSFNNGRFSGTDINPMWRIKKLTELFGPAGLGWYYEVIGERCESHGEVTMAIVDLLLYIRDPESGDWSKPIFGTGGNKLLEKGRASDEGYKMALTDALSVACKALGIGADVYFAKDKTKYTDGDTDPSTAARSPSPVTSDRGGMKDVPAPGRQTRLGLTGKCRRCKCDIDERTEEYSWNKFGMALCPLCQVEAEKYYNSNKEEKLNA